MAGIRDSDSKIFESLQEGSNFIAAKSLAVAAGVAHETDFI